MVDAARDSKDAELTGGTADDPHRLLPHCSEKRVLVEEVFRWISSDDQLGKHHEVCTSSDGIHTPLVDHPGVVFQRADRRIALHERYVDRSHRRSVFITTALTNLYAPGAIDCIPADDGPQRCRRSHLIFTHDLATPGWLGPRSP